MAFAHCCLHAVGCVVLMVAPCVVGLVLVDCRWCYLHVVHCWLLALLGPLVIGACMLWVDCWRLLALLVIVVMDCRSLLVWCWLIIVGCC